MSVKLSGANYEIYFEDCIEGMKRIEDDSVDLIIADAPFGIAFDGKQKGNYNRDSNNVIAGYNEIQLNDYEVFSVDWLSQAKRVLKPYGAIYVFSSWNRLNEVFHAIGKLGLYHHSHLTWSRTFPVYKRWNWVDSMYHILMLLKYHAPRTGKPSHTFNKIETKNPKTGEMRHYPRSDLQFPEVYLRGIEKNGTKLPNSLVEHLILTSSNENELVLDPFLGNGTTAVEALRANRRFVGFEINTNARDIIERAIRTCDDCRKFRRPSWLMDVELGICGEGMFGDGEPSDKNDSICEHFKEKEE